MASSLKSARLASRKYNQIHYKRSRRVTGSECIFCDLTFSIKQNFEMHMNSHTQERPFDCSHCDDNFSSTSSLQTHLNTVHFGERHYCKNCNESFMNLQDLSDHKRVHFGKKLLDLANIFSDKRYGIQPAKENHEENIFTTFNMQDKRSKVSRKPTSSVCAVCDKSFKAYWKLEQHMNSHTKEHTFECDQCSVNYTTSSALWVHKKYLHVRKSYVCKICHKMFGNRSNFVAHEKSHVRNSSSVGRPIKDGNLSKKDACVSTLCPVNEDKNVVRNSKSFKLMQVISAIKRLEVRVLLERCDFGHDPVKSTKFSSGDASRENWGDDDQGILGAMPSEETINLGDNPLSFESPLKDAVMFPLPDIEISGELQDTPVCIKSKSPEMELDQFTITKMSSSFIEEQVTTFACEKGILEQDQIEKIVDLAEFSSGGQEKCSVNVNDLAREIPSPNSTTTNQSPSCKEITEEHQRILSLEPSSSPLIPAEIVNSGETTVSHVLKHAQYDGCLVMPTSTLEAISATSHRIKVKSYKCNFCQSKFAQMSHLKVHLGSTHRISLSLAVAKGLMGINEIFVRQF